MTTPSVSQDGPPGDHEQSILSHLMELRDRLLRCFVALLVTFLPLSFFANDLYTWLSQPLLRHLPQDSKMIATQVTSPFMAPFKLTAFAALVLAVPYLFYQAWAFIAPGLYQNEKRLVAPVLVSSTLLFYAGIAFAYFAVFPIMFAFFTATAPEGVAVMTDISSYLTFVLSMFLSFGLVFEVPIATFLLVRAGIIARETLVAQRPYIIVGAFIAGMILTPTTDVVSQTMLSVPIWLLFELGLWFTRFIK
ncbi:MAG: twin-arginine translocase subunit TatC [Gammaproteobacteria bacterium]|nr:twin-arginine translocase subunit TatC [Gammaproteobacteria bacterium]